MREWGTKRQGTTRCVLFSLPPYASLPAGGSYSTGSSHPGRDVDYLEEYLWFHLPVHTWTLVRLYQSRDCTAGFLPRNLREATLGQSASLW